MRYLKDQLTAEVELVSDDDDERFYSLLAERVNGQPKYVQTGAHDPAVTAVTVPGQHPATLEEQTTGIDPSIALKPGGTAPAADGDDALKTRVAELDAREKAIAKREADAEKTAKSGEAEKAKIEKALADREKKTTAAEAELEKRTKALDEREKQVAEREKAAADAAKAK